MVFPHFLTRESVARFRCGADCSRLATARTPNRRRLLKPPNGGTVSQRQLAGEEEDGMGGLGAVGASVRAGHADRGGLRCQRRGPRELTKRSAFAIVFSFKPACLRLLVI